MRSDASRPGGAGRRTWKYLAFVLVLFLIFYIAKTRGTTAEGWTTYRHDNRHSAVTKQPVTPPLSLAWTFQPAHPPQPAWAEPAEEMERAHDDNAYLVSAAGGLVYFGSSVDNKVYALDLATGEVRWSFYTAGPVRYAPTIWKDRVYFGSDDGHVYCLRARDGKLVWKYRAGPTEEKVLGNQRMISLWPVRTSILVAGGVVYFGAGVFPYEGIYICALKAGDGAVIWKNDTIGDRAHELSFGGISPQGYLLASAKTLYVPSARAMPAAFDRRSGRFLYYCLPGAKVGGTWALLDGEDLVAGVDLSGTPAKVTYDQQTGERRKEDLQAWFPGLDLVLTPAVSYTLTPTGIFAIDRDRYRGIRRQLDELKQRRRELTSKLSDLRRKLLSAAPGARGRLNQERDQVVKQISGLTAEEDSLKTALCDWKYSDTGLSTLMLAGKFLYAGGDGKLVGIDAKTGARGWEAQVNGKVRGLAAVKGNLLVSTRNGKIYCFREGRPAPAKQIKPTITASPYPEDDHSAVYRAAADAILKATGIKKGYCLVLDAGTGRLAYELARRSELSIVGIESDAAKVETAKRKLDQAGLYGSRVVVEAWKPAELPDYFANLIVDDQLVVSGNMSVPPQQVYRVLRPYGGVACFGRPARKDAGEAFQPRGLLDWFAGAGAAEQPEVVNQDGTWVKLVRGELEGAGSWTHQYGNPENTACSHDKLVSGPLGVLWFGEPGPRGMLDRHAKAQSPVSMDGRLFIEGEETIMAYDAYNGAPLWKRHIPGAVRAFADRDGGNLALSASGLYVAAHDRCFRLDPASGRTLRTYRVPGTRDGRARRWAGIAYADGILYGTAASSLSEDYATLWKLFVKDGKWADISAIPLRHRLLYEAYKAQYPVPDERLRAAMQRAGDLWKHMTEFPRTGEFTIQGAVDDRMLTSDTVFAIDPDTGRLLWTYRGRKIAQITMALGDGKIFFAEAAVTAAEKQLAFDYKQRMVRAGRYRPGPEQAFEPAEADVRLVVALDARTGRLLWKKPLDLTGCGGDWMGSAYGDGLLLFFASFGNHDAWRWKAGNLRWRRVMAVSAGTGAMAWSRAINYRTRPLIVGDKLIIEPRACDLHTGEILTRPHPVTGLPVPWEFLRPGHTCAITSASADTMFYRSSSTAIYDLAGDRGVTLFGAIRPGCLINMVPANGLLLFPEASSGCTCSFPLRCSLALKPKPRHAQPWTVFITHGPMTPARHFAINLGAPADMKDEDGTVWFGYPNPVTEYWHNHFPDYGVKFNLHDSYQQGMGYFCRDFKGVSIAGAGDKPWLYTSGCLGFSECRVPLINDLVGQRPGVYTVRLGFLAPPGDRPGQRVFDILLQDRPVARNFDIVREAGGPQRALVREFKAVKVANDLKITLVAAHSNPDMKQAPLVNFIEVIREDAANIPPPRKAPPALSAAEAHRLLRTATAELTRNKPEAALKVLHTVLDRSAPAAAQRQSLEMLARIASPESLAHLPRYFSNVDPVLWDYDPPPPEVAEAAAAAYVAIARKVVKTDRRKGVRMLEYALNISSDNLANQVKATLRELGVSPKNGVAD